MKSKALFLVLALCCWAVTGLAQTSRGTVSGTVTDPTCAVIAGASVTLTNTGTMWAALDHGHWGAKLSRSKDGGASWSEVAPPKYPEGAAPIVRGEAVNTATTYGYDSVTMMQETKTTVCQIERAA